MATGANSSISLPLGRPTTRSYWYRQGVIYYLMAPTSTAHSWFCEHQGRFVHTGRQVAAYMASAGTSTGGCVTDTGVAWLVLR